MMGSQTSLTAALAEGKHMAADDFREKLGECLGGPWPQACDLRPQVRETMQKEGYRIESVSYEVEPGERVPALLLIPDGVDASHPAPAASGSSLPPRRAQPGQGRDELLSPETQAGVAGVQRDREGLGHLGHGAAVELVHHEHDPPLRRQRGQRLADLLLLLVGGRLLLRARRPVRGLPRADRLLPTVTGPAPLVRGDAVGDARQPGTERATRS